MSPKPPKLRNAQDETSKRAAKIANRKAREELLGSNAPEGLARRLAKLSSTDISIIREKWAPFEIDKGARTGFGLKLVVEGNPLVRQALLDTGTYDRLREIATESMQEAMVSVPSFAKTLLEDLILSKDSYYASFR